MTRFASITLINQMFCPAPGISRRSYGQVVENSELGTLWGGMPGFPDTNVSMLSDGTNLPVTL